ncbi:MAG: SDR family oxidoreductase [Alphaproteobacteria bacterium]|nr:SDR family oxidoreductase [Alphaproteobacteria bacterium]
MKIACAGLRVVVTAGAAGIGRAIAETLLDAGARVHICDVDPAAMDRARQELPGIGVTPADVSEPADVDKLFAEAKATLGGLDALINNAGIAGPTLPIEDIEPKDWNRTLAINLTGQYLCARRAVPLLKAGGGGSIVMMSSAAGRFGYPLRSPYAATKWATIGLTETLAMELGEHKIRVNAICPGIVAGPRIDAVIGAKAKARGMTFEEMRERYLGLASMHTMVSAQDIANMVLYLVSDVGRTISGQALSIDGNLESLKA